MAHKGRHIRQHLIRKTNNIPTGEAAILNRWAELFNAVLNGPADINAEAIFCLSQVEKTTEFGERKTPDGDVIPI